MLMLYLQSSYFNPLRPRGRRRAFDSRASTDKNFNPLRPRGRRLCIIAVIQFRFIFQPTPPARTETINGSAASPSAAFQPTPPARTETMYPHIGGTIVKFQPTPPARTETCPFYYLTLDLTISTHSAREDGDSNTTQKNQQFFITFPQSNHIILPQITANLPCTHPKPFSLCSFSGANPPVNSCLLLVRTKLFETSLPPAARSEYQRLFHFNPFTHPNMVHLCSVFISQVVKSKAVSLLINDICQYGF